MDRTEVSGTSGVGSIPSGATKSSEFKKAKKNTFSNSLFSEVAFHLVSHKRMFLQWHLTK